MWQSNEKSIFFTSFPMLACRREVKPRGNQVSCAVTYHVNKKPTVRAAKHPS